MSLYELPKIKDWLSQFSPPDLYLAEHMLAKLRYISFEESEIWLQESLDNVISKIEKVRKHSIAIFPVAKPFINEFNINKKIKLPNDSSGRIAHSLTNLKRRLPQRIEISPRIESMRSRKVKHIIFVDDYIGTGDRFIKSWRETVSPTVKSWIALGWCKVWLVSYAAHREGMARILRNVRAVDKSRLSINLIVDKSFMLADKRLKELCLMHGARLSEKNIGLGYGELMSPIVFQYGCPNNAPGILWCKGKSRATFKPLFPNRSVSSDMYKLFGVDHSSESTAEELWLTKHYSMAIQFLERKNDFGEERLELILLAYINAKKDLKKVRAFLVLSDDEFGKLLESLAKYGLIDEKFSITRFGLEILQRGSRMRPLRSVGANEYQQYYPSSFLGFQRDV